MVIIPANQIRVIDNKNIIFDSKKNEWDLQIKNVEQAIIWIVVFHFANIETSNGPKKFHIASSMAPVSDPGTIPNK